MLLSSEQHPKLALGYVADKRSSALLLIQSLHEFDSLIDCVKACIVTPSQFHFHPLTRVSGNVSEFKLASIPKRIRLKGFAPRLRTEQRTGLRCGSHSGLIST